MSTLIFPSSQSQLQHDRSAIRQSLKSTFNRLHSIHHDSAFVSRVSREVFGGELPVIANQRAGSWYVDARAGAEREGKGKGREVGSLDQGSEEHEEARKELPKAYFKSTDGHTGQTDFNLRRANLALLEPLLEYGGIILVDSTRRGKRYPDAFSKTVPIWCSVLNTARRSLLNAQDSKPSAASESEASSKEVDGLRTSPEAVSRSEHAVIEAKVHGWAEKLLSSSYDLTPLLELSKPLRPIFIDPSTPLPLIPSTSASSEPYIPVVLISASKLASAINGDAGDVVGRLENVDGESEAIERSGGFVYVQGAGDDHESWSNNLTPSLFWAHKARLLSARNDDDLSLLVNEIVFAATSLSGSQPPDEDVEASTNDGGGRLSCCEVKTTGIKFGLGLAKGTCTDRPTPLLSRRRVTISTINTSASPPSTTTDPASPMITSIVSKPGKPGHNLFFSTFLPKVLAPPERAEGVEEVAADVNHEEVEEWEILTPAGDKEAVDYAVALGLVLLCRFDDAGHRFSADSAPAMTKPLIRTRLEWILASLGSGVNPSRTILNRVNEFVISRSSGRIGGGK